MKLRIKNNIAWLDVVCLAVINLSIVEKQDNFDKDDATDISSYPIYLPINYFKNPQSLNPSGNQRFLLRRDMQGDTHVPGS